MNSTKEINRRNHGINFSSKNCKTLEFLSLQNLRPEQITWLQYSSPFIISFTFYFHKSCHFKTKKLFFDFLSLTCSCFLRYPNLGKDLSQNWQWYVPSPFCCTPSTAVLSLFRQFSFNFAFFMERSFPFSSVFAVSRLFSASWIKEFGVSAPSVDGDGEKLDDVCDEYMSINHKRKDKIHQSNLIERKTSHAFANFFLLLFD